MNINRPLAVMLINLFFLRIMILLLMLLLFSTRRDDLTILIRAAAVVLEAVIKRMMMVEVGGREFATPVLETIDSVGKSAIPFTRHRQS